MIGAFPTALKRTTTLDVSRALYDSKALIASALGPELPEMGSPDIAEERALNPRMGPRPLESTSGDAGSDRGVCIQQFWCQ